MPMDEWILHTMKVETFDYNTKTLVGETLSKGMRRHQNAKSFNCGRIGYLRRDCRQGIPQNKVSSGNGKIRRSYHSVGDVAKTDIGAVNVDQQKTDKATW